MKIVPNRMASARVLKLTTGRHHRRSSNACWLDRVLAAASSLSLEGRVRW